MARWVQIRRYLVRESVTVERSVLESAGLTVWSPDEQWYSTYPIFADTSKQGYRLFVIDSEVEDARAILGYRDDSETSFPCPETGGKSRRLKNIPGTILLSLFFLYFGGPCPAPVNRTMRIGVKSRVRFTPEPPEPFTPEELGYVVESPRG